MAIKLATKKATARKIVKKTTDVPVEKPVKKPMSELDPHSVEAKLRALYDLQQIDSQIDKIRIVRGELPIEVRDLEDEVAGLGNPGGKLPGRNEEAGGGLWHAVSTR